MSDIVRNKVKIFIADNNDQLEEKINNWFRLETGVEVVGVSYADTMKYPSALVHYRSKL